MIWLLKRLSGIDLVLYRKKGMISGLIIIFILALDLHRFGAWYYGYRTYLKPWSVPVLLIIAFPFIKYTCAMLVQYAVNMKKFDYILYVMTFFACLPFSVGNPYVLPYIFDFSKEWYDKGIFNSWPQVLAGAVHIFFTTLGLTVLSLFCKWVYDEDAGFPGFRKVIRIIFSAPQQGRG